MKEVIINPKKIYHSVLFAIIVLFGFYPGFFNYMPIISKVDVLVNLAIAAGICLYFFSCLKLNRSLLLVVTCIFFQLFSTILNHANIAIAIWGQGILLFAMYGALQWAYYYDEKLTLFTTYGGFYLLLIINLLSLCLFPEGLFEDSRGIRDTNFFLGNYNGFIVYIFTAIISGYLYLARYKKKVPVHYILLWILAFATFIQKRSMTSIFGLTILLVFLVFFNSKRFRLFLNIKVYTIINALFFLTVVWSTADNWFLQQITTIIGKDITFTGRTLIWANAKPQIMQHLFLGKGLETEEVIAENLGFVQAVNAHNLYLDLLYKGGVLKLIVVTLLFILVVRQLKHLANQKVRYFLEAFLGIFMFMSQFEAYSIKAIFFILLLIYLYASNNQKTQAGCNV